MEQYRLIAALEAELEAAKYLTEYQQDMTADVARYLRAMPLGYVQALMANGRTNGRYRELESNFYLWLMSQKGMVG